MKKLFIASTLALLVVGLSQAPASANFTIHKPCIEIPLPPFPLVIPNIKITCLKAPCEGYQSPNPWYTYYPPAAYGPYAQVYYPIYGAPPAIIAPVPVPPPPPVPAPVRPAAQEPAKGVVPTAATQNTAAKAAKQTNSNYATARSAIGPKLNDVAGIQRAQPAPQYPQIYQLQPVVGGSYDFGGASSGAPSYWYGR